VKRYRFIEPRAKKLPDEGKKENVSDPKPLPTPNHYPKPLKKRGNPLALRRLNVHECATDTAAGFLCRITGLLKSS
jgi:hypothetical protein